MPHEDSNTTVKFVTWQVTNIHLRKNTHFRIMYFLPYDGSKKGPKLVALSMITVKKFLCSTAVNIVELRNQDIKERTG
jgi:hypothetical protein